MRNTTDYPSHNIKLYDIVQVKKLKCQYVIWSCGKDYKIYIFIGYYILRNV